MQNFQNRNKQGRKPAHGMDIVSVIWGKTNGYNDMRLEIIILVHHIVIILAVTDTSLVNTEGDL